MLLPPQLFIRPLLVLTLGLALLACLPPAVEAQPGALPLRLVAETEQGMEAARRCAALWEEEGPALTAALLPAGVTPDTVVCLVLETESFERRFQNSIPDWGVGVAFPGGRLVALDHTRLNAVGKGLREVFLHEMVHALLFQGAGQAWLPTWFHEGCAMHYSGEWRFTDTVSLVLDGRVPSLDFLQGRFPQAPVNADRAYRTSLLAVGRLMKQGGPDVPRLLVAETRRQGNFLAAFPLVTGMTLEAFTDDFAAAMELRLGWVVMITRWPTLFVLIGLVFLIGGGAKLIRSRRRLAMMEDEED
jgi:hypothetical protein